MESGTEKNLKALGKKPPPKDFLDDIARFSKLPESAKDSIWDAIEKSISPTQDDSDDYLNQFISTHNISDSELIIKVLNSLIYLINNAFANDLSLSWFSEDLQTLGFKDSEKATLLAEYDQVKAKYRNTAMIRTIGDHGFAFLGASWKINNIQASNRGHHLNFQTIDISFRFHDHGSEKKHTLTFTPQNLIDIKSMIDEIFDQFSTDVIKIKNNKS